MAKIMKTRTNRFEWITPEKLLLIAGWRRNGLTIEEIAKNIGIGLSTFYEWMDKSPEIVDNLKIGKEEADTMVENALFKNAINGDNTAIIFYLKNRVSNRWRDRQDLSVDGQFVNTVREDLKCLSTEELKERLDALNKNSDKE